MGSLSIRNKLFVYSLLLSFASLLMVGVFAYTIARKALLERTYNQLTAIREEKGRQVESFFINRERDAALIAQSEHIVGLIAESIEVGEFRADSFLKLPQVRSILYFLSSANCYSSMAIANSAGQVLCTKFDTLARVEHYMVATLKSNPTNPTFSSIYAKVKEQKAIVINDFTTGSLVNAYSVTVAAPLYSDGDFVGVLFLEIPDKTMNALMADRLHEIGLGNTGEVYLAGDDYLLRSSSRFAKQSILSVESKTLAVERALAGQKGCARIVDYRGERVLSSYAPLNIPSISWVVVAEMDWQEAMRQVNRLKLSLGLIGMIVFILVGIAVFIFSSRLTKPLTELKNAAVRVGEGKFDKVLPISERDEIGLLTQVFNQMTLRLKHTTQRLKERESRLLHFYRATIDGILIHKSAKPILVNRALINLTGYNEAQLLTLSPQQLFKEDEHLLKFIESSQVNSFESILMCNGGVQVPVEVQHRRLNYHDQEVSVLVIRDISERKAIEDELKEERLHRLRSVIDGQEQERQRLSRELHDGLGQTLVAIKLRLESMTLSELGEQAKTIELVKQMFNQTIDETRRISNNLMPAALTEFSLAVVLRNLCNEVEGNSGVRISLVVGVLPENISMLTKTYAYRIAQEALTNIVKHAQASKAVVSVFSDILKIYLTIEDDGVGFNQKNVNTGNGLYNMKERSSLLNGRFEIVSAEGKGTRIRVEFPINNHTTNAQ
jgi:PAS domain S-box-containing protein